MKQNNKGFSLVEVIVAAAVMVILVTPLMSSFITSINASAKAKMKMQTTSVAQNIMEEVTALPMGDVIGDAGWAAYKEDSAGSLNAVPDAERKDAQVFIKEDGSGIAMGGNKFDARITIDSRNYDIKADPTVLGSKPPATSNEWELVNIQSIDYDQDAYYIDEESVIGSFVPSTGATVADTFYNLGVTNLAGMERTIKVDIVKAGEDALGVSLPKVLVTYTYKCGGHTVVIDDEKVIFDSNATGEQLRNLYLFLQTPADLGTSGNKVIINNTMQQPMTVYLVKQSGGDSTRTVYVTVNETGDNSWIGNTNFKSMTKLRSNFGWFVESSDSTLHVTFKRSVSSKNSVSHKADITKIMDCVNITNKGTQKRLYEVKIEIFKHQSNISEQFKDEDKLFTLSGTKES